MAWIHIGVDLENKTTENILVGSYNPFLRNSQQWGWRKFNKTIQHFLYPKIVDGGTAQYRNLISFQIRLPVERIVYHRANFQLANKFPGSHFAHKSSHRR